MAGVLADHERGPARRADGRTAVTLGEARAFLGHTIQVGRLDKFLPVAADIALGEIIAEDEDDVGLTNFRAADEGREKQEG